MTKGDATALRERARELAAQVNQAQAADLAGVLASACDLVEAAVTTPELRPVVSAAVARMEHYLAEHGDVSEGAFWTERMRATVRTVKRLRRSEHLGALDEDVFEGLLAPETENRS
jgi:hypothetical protein